MNISTLVLGFLEYCGIYREKRQFRGGAPEVGSTHLGVPRPPGAPWWVVAPSGHPPGVARALVFLSLIHI